MDERLRASLAELVGTFTLVFIGAAAVASEQGVVVTALAYGLALVGVFYVYGRISGAHVNPAVTAGLLVGGEIGWGTAVSYWVGQFVGGVLGAMVLELVVVGGATDGQTVGSLTGDLVWSAAIFESVMTFFLVSAVWQAAVFGRARDFAGLAIGFTLLAAVLAGGTYTGASLNPARTFGPALVAGDFSYLVPYLIGMFGGGIVAGLVQTALFRPE